MSFLHPQFLYYMIIPLIILFAFILTQRSKQMKFFSDEVLKRLSIRDKYLSIRSRNILYFFIFFFLIITLAQPVIPDGKVRVQTRGANVILALDTSVFMQAKDLYPNRLQVAKHKMLEFIKLFHSNKIGIITFAKNSFLVSPLSFDHKGVSFLLKRLQPTLIIQSGANFGQLLYSINQMIKSKTKKYLVIFTDGGVQKSFTDEIQYAKKHNIIVFVLGIGTKKGIAVPTKNGFLTHNGDIVISKLNQNIVSLATHTGGIYIHGVLSNADVKRLVNEINIMTRGDVLKAHMVVHYIALFYFPLAFALLLLLIAMSSIRNIRKIDKVIYLALISLFLYSAFAKSYLTSLL